MEKFAELLLGKKIGKARIIPVRFKILITFLLIFLASNISSNYINLVYNRAELIRQMKELLIKDLRDMVSFTNNQYEISNFTKNLEDSIEEIERKGKAELKNSRSFFIGVKPEGSLLFQAYHKDNFANYKSFDDINSLSSFKQNKEKGIAEGFQTIQFQGKTYLAAYKYNENWDAF